MRRSVILATVVLLVAVVLAPAAAVAKPSIEVFDAKEGWICGSAEGLVDNHCLNTRSKGTVLNIKVFEPDPRGPQESGSMNSKFDSRPCPHDDGSDDGTWWEVVEGFYVCHHSGSQ